MLICSFALRRKGDIMKEFLINLVVIFIVKVIDNILSTSKTILVQKNKALLASITLVISNINFYNRENEKR